MMKVVKFHTDLKWVHLYVALGRVRTGCGKDGRLGGAEVAEISVAP